MKKTILIVLTILTILSSYSQKWEHTIGEPGQHESSNRITEHYDKGYLITGYIGKNGGQSGQLFKTDINGNMLWDVVFGEDPDMVLLAKTVYDEQGNLYIFGVIDQDLDPHWPLVIKLNPCGEMLWCKQLYFEGHDYGFFNDGILLDNGDLLGVASLPNDNQHDMIYLFCLSPEGDYKWKKSYASKDNYPLFEMRLGERIQHFEDIYIISGYTYAPHPDYPDISSLRPMFIGIDTLFQEQWVLVFGMEDNKKGKAYESVQVSDSVIMGVGINRYSQDGNQMGNTFLMFYDKNGKEIDYNIIPNEDFAPEIKQNFLTSIERYNDSLYIGTGFIGYEYQGSPCGEMIIDTSGNIHNYQIRDGVIGSAYLAKTFDNKYAIASSIVEDDLTLDIYFYKINEDLESDTLYPGVYNYDSLCNDLPIGSGTIDLTGCDVITSLEEIPALEDYYTRQQTIGIRAYPNPSKEEPVTFGFSNTGNFQDLELKCFNVFGKLVHKEKIYQHQGESKINILNWQSGIYMALIYSNGQVVGRTKFVVQ